MRAKAALLGSLIGAIVLTACGSGSPPELSVVMSDFAFEPKQLTLQPGQRATILLQNRGSMDHTFSIPDLRVASGNVAPGQTAKVEVAGPARVYKFMCAIPGHDEQGMVGELRVQRR
jgi:uncharacterized cupredoxin-like copper-binding protein